MTRCPICEASRFRPVLSLHSTPVNIGALYTDHHGALEAPRGDIELALCEGCGLIRNLAFDPGLMVYDTHYENSQMFSPTFRRFAEDLANTLVSRYGIRGGRAVEIGCGKGEFLKLLCQAGVGQGVGYDPTYDGEVDDCGDVSIHRQFYDTEQDPQADLLLSRHVVEHLEDPLGMLRGLRRSLEGTSTPLYLEVPDARFVMGGEGQWDIIYPHVNYFCDLAMRKLLIRAGFRPENVESVFSEQFLAAHAVPGEIGPGEPDPVALSAWVARIDAFAERFRATVERWSRTLDAKAQQGPVVLWGAGAKGLAFLNFIGAGDYVAAAVDVNPRKHGAFLPCTGHEIVAPEALRQISPATVLVTNTQYEPEIRSSLQKLDIHCETICV